MVIGRECIQIINKNVLNEIAHAMNSLHADLLHTDKDVAKSIVEEVIKDSKRVVNCYFDEQKITLLKLIDIS